MFEQKKNVKNSIFIFWIVITLLAFPKITIVNIAGYWQGIRLENIICFLFFLLLAKNTIVPYLYNYNKTKKLRQSFVLNDLDETDNKIIGLAFFKFYPFLIFGCFIGILNGYDQEVTIFMRLIEYLTIILAFNSFKIDFKLFVLVLKYILFLNLLISIGQYYELLGHFSSKGYQDANFLFFRSPGIFSSTLESGFITTIIFFILVHQDRKNFFRFLIIVMLILFLAFNRSLIVAFVFSTFVFYAKNTFFKKKYVILKLIFLIINLYLAYYILNFVFHFDILVLTSSLYDLFINNYVKPHGELPDQYYSWTYRLLNWQIHVERFMKNIFNFLFGVGSQAIYYESSYMRVLFSSGVVGLFSAIFLMRKTPLYISIFILTVSVSADILVSFKIFIILLIYFHAINHIKKNELNY
jgi:hypothetical protein